MSFALHFSDKLAHVTKNKFAVGEKGEFEIKGDQGVFRVKKLIVDGELVVNKRIKTPTGRSRQREAARFRRQQAGGQAIQWRRWQRCRQCQPARSSWISAMQVDPCLDQNVGRRRIFWTTGRRRAASYNAVRRRSARFRAGVRGYADPYPDRICRQQRFRTIKNDEWLHGLILNILNTRARTDVRCPTPAAVYGHWSESYRDDDLYIGSTMWNAAEKSYIRTADCVKAIDAAVRADMGKLIAHGIATVGRGRSDLSRLQQCRRRSSPCHTSTGQQHASICPAVSFPRPGSGTERTMTCIIPRPDPQVLFDQLKNMFSSTVLGGGKVYPGIERVVRRRQRLRRGRAVLRHRRSDVARDQSGDRHAAKISTRWRRSTACFRSRRRTPRATPN